MTDDLPEVRHGHPFVMYEMLKSVPGSMSEISGSMEDFRASFLRGNLNFTGNGTAYHAAAIGSYFLRNSEKESRCIQAFELEKYENISGTLAAVSHSGKTKSTLDAMIKFRGKVLTVGITHDTTSPIALNSDVHIALPNRDLSLCNTRAFYNNAIAVMHISAAYSGMDPGIRKAVSDISEIISSCEQRVKEVVQRMSIPDHIYVLGAGPNYYCAREAAQKIKEATHIPAEGIELEEFNHGCTAVMSEKTLIVLICTDTVEQRAMDIIRGARHVGSPVLTINGEADDNLSIRTPESEVLSPLYNIGPLYFLAYYLALKTGVNPDLLRFDDRRYRDYDNEVFPPGTH